jgi:hypothetical protein
MMSDRLHPHKSAPLGHDKMSGSACMKPCHTYPAYSLHLREPGSCEFSLAISYEHNLNLYSPSKGLPHAVQPFLHCS